MEEEGGARGENVDKTETTICSGREMEESDDETTEECTVRVQQDAFVFIWTRPDDSNSSVSV